MELGENSIIHLANPCYKYETCGEKYTKKRSGNWNAFINGSIEPKTVTSNLLYAKIMNVNIHHASIQCTLFYLTFKKFNHMIRPI